MIRFIHIGGQINKDADEFAFFDTVTDRFVTIYDDQTWGSRDDLIESMALADMSGRDRERMLSLLPTPEPR